MSETKMIANDVRWNSNMGFILATAGSAVGLGNIWRFSYLAGENGGAIFLLFYLLFVALLCIPVMLVEVGIGRIGRADPYHSIQNINNDHLKDKSNRAWLLLGALGLGTSLIIMFFYPVIGGWVIHFFVQAAAGNLPADLAQAETTFTALLENPSLQMVWHLLFLVVSAAIVAVGLNNGIERAAKILMPTLLFLLLVLVVYALIVGDAAAGLSFLFKPDFSKISTTVLAQALGQAFFSLSLGIGILLTFGAYTDNKRSLTKDLSTIALIDTSVAILAGVAIFPIVFQIGLEPAAGPALVFLSLPVAFASMPGGGLLMTVFFALLVFAAVTSAISLLEPSVQFLKARFNISRTMSTIVVTVMLWLVGIFVIFDANLIDVFDKLSSYMLPACGIGMCLLVGWGIDKDTVNDTLGLTNKDSFFVKYWWLIVKWIAPIVISMILINAAVA